MKIIYGLKNSLKHDMKIAGVKMYRMNKYESPEKRLFLDIITIIGSVLFVSALFIGGCMSGEAQAAGVNDDKAVLAIIGEAEDQGYDGMKAVACAIRNRGTLRGVYGLNAPRVKKHLYSQGIEAKAIIAWRNSADTEECLFIGGADHWENIKAFGKPKWAGKMVETYHYKDHVFYRRTR